MMQFDVFPNPDPGRTDDRPYIVVLQHNHLIDLSSVVVAPLVKAESVLPLAGLMPTVVVDGARFHAVVPDLGAISKRHLKGAVANVSTFRDDLIKALDRLFTGL
ncbi:CcdB family protein [Rhizobiales bacterium]|uniref:CcdB family protein n=1 Tax=Hongsoonwoonella zoysiae TaxID=2821844 RepID=UPI0015609BEB|nr:CcdB family protein [Hongsoonwoonella zoysiae]NRG19205.1 CcdB family protein [Hongsoonwoonella zoysiae]